ncbi:MAG: hypothetical protein R3335_10215 [Anaerolineales bacterium]|nr:hypothetical protein [Anaerolineales bacterium]
MARKEVQFTLVIGSVLVFSLLSACSSLIATSTGEPGPPVVETSAPAPGPALREVLVDSVTVEIGVGSPIPVEVVVSGSWPDACAELASIERQSGEGSFDFTLLASPAEPNCPPDAVGIPFRLAIPLNMVEKQVGTYSVSANGVEAAFDWDPSAPPVTGEEPPVDDGPASALRIAYLGPDGNVWAVDWPGGTPQQLTSDADSGPMDGTMPTTPIINYHFPAISSDGRLVAFRRDFSTPATGSLDFSSGLWVHDRETNQLEQVYDGIPAGIAWKPGTHLLAFGQGVDEGYFLTRGEPDASLATGIRGVDFDTGQDSELVAPERGLALYTPVWSPDGRFLSFNELIGYEGSGNFAYYDFESQEYVGWDEAIGFYDWSPDSEELVFDWMTYTATGTERIFSRSRLGDDERQLTPDLEGSGYAYAPAISPQGDRVAYLAGLEGPDSQNFTVQILDLASGAILDLGTFESAFGLGWSPDGNSLFFSAGPWEGQQVYVVDLPSGSITAVTPGSQPAVSGNLP